MTIYTEIQLLHVYTELIERFLFVHHIANVISSIDQDYLAESRNVRYYISMF